MIIDVTGVTSGSSPYLVYLCDWNLNSCFFITGVTSIPPIVHIDSNYYFPGLQLLKVKIFDNDGCFEIIDAPCLPTPQPNPPPPPTPLPGCAPCIDVCTYWQINLGAGPCIFKLFDCDGNVVNLRFFGTAGTYYVESVLQPQPFNQNCGYTIIDLGPCPTPLPQPTQMPGCIEYDISNVGEDIVEFTFTPCCFTVPYPQSPLVLPGGENINICSDTFPLFSDIGGVVVQINTCPCPTPLPDPTPIPTDLPPTSTPAPTPTCSPCPTPLPTPPSTPSNNCKSGCVPPNLLYSYYSCCGNFISGFTDNITIDVCYNNNNQTENVIITNDPCDMYPNYCYPNEKPCWTWDFLFAGGNITFSGDDTIVSTIITSDSLRNVVLGTVNVTYKTMYSVVISTNICQGAATRIGFANHNINFSSDPYGLGGFTTSVALRSDGTVYYNNTPIYFNGPDNWVAGDVIDVAYFVSKFWVRVNGGNWNNQANNNPSTNIGGYSVPSFFSGSSFYPAIQFGDCQYNDEGIVTISQQSTLPQNFEYICSCGIPRTCITWDYNYTSDYIDLKDNNLIAQTQFIYPNAVVNPGYSLVTESNVDSQRTTYTIKIINNLHSGSRIGFAQKYIPKYADNYVLGSDTKSIGFTTSGSVYYNNILIATTGLIWGAVNDVIDIAIFNCRVWFRVNCGNWNNDAYASPDHLQGQITMEGLCHGVSYYLAAQIWPIDKNSPASVVLLSETDARVACGNVDITSYNFFDTCYGPECSCLYFKNMRGNTSSVSYSDVNNNLITIVLQPSQEYTAVGLINGALINNSYVIIVVFASCDIYNNCIAFPPPTSTPGPTAGPAPTPMPTSLYSLGQYYGGGYIVYIDPTGLHGVIVADQPQTDSKWGCYGTYISNTNGGYFDGQQNTINIVAGCNENSAAKVCSNLSLNGYNDWYLPSSYELWSFLKSPISVYNNNVINIHSTTGFYWSSTENSAYQARTKNWYVTGNSYLPQPDRKDKTKKVRCVRRF